MLLAQKFYLNKTRKWFFAEKFYIFICFILHYYDEFNSLKMIIYMNIDLKNIISMTYFYRNLFSFMFWMHQWKVSSIVHCADLDIFVRVNSSFWSWIDLHFLLCDVQLKFKTYIICSEMNSLSVFIQAESFLIRS